MNIESYSEVIDLMVLECKEEERENVLTIMFTCESMYHNNIVIKIKMSQSLT